MKEIITDFVCLVLHLRDRCRHILRCRRLSEKYGCSISPTAMLSGPDSAISIGEGTAINAYVNVRFREGRVKIGRNVLFGQFVSVLVGTHKYEDKSKLIKDQGTISGDIEIGDDVWIGAHSVIMPGVKLGKGAVVGAQSVVTCDVPEYEVWAGVPARKLKERR
jgi:acetyltransferase-like isoleucine patch superfamily enzyme